MSSTSPTTTEESTISIPSLLLLSLLIFFAYRFFTRNASSSSSSSSTSSNSSTRSGPRMRFTPQQVETVCSMFPQLNRRDVMWSLQRSGGSVGAVVEGVLGGRGVESAPPSFQPPPHFFPTPSSSSATSTQPLKTEPDLITRYNLQNRISTSDKGKQKDVAESPSSGAGVGVSAGLNGWSSSKDERAKMMRERREEMILKARRRMMERDAEGNVS